MEYWKDERMERRYKWKMQGYKDDVITPHTTRNALS
jgi:hypothetical protein